MHIGQRRKTSNSVSVIMTFIIAIMVVVGALNSVGASRAHAQKESEGASQFALSQQRDALSARLSAQCKHVTWRGLRAALQLHLYDPTDALQSCERPMRRTAPLGSIEAAHRWTLARAALLRRQPERLARLLAPLRPLRGARVQILKDAHEASPNGAIHSQDRGDVAKAWSEVAPSYDSAGWISAEHLQPDETLQVSWELPRTSRGAYLGIGYRGAIKVKIDGVLITSLSHNERPWVDQKIIALDTKKTEQTLTLELSLGSEVFVRRIERRERTPTPMSFWERGMRTLKRDARRLSDDALVALSLFAHLTDLSDHARLLPLLEADTRWSQRPRLDLILAFWGLSPPAVRAQVWSDYPLERVQPPLPTARRGRISGADEALAQSLFYQDLLIKRSLSNLRHDRLTEAAQDIERAVERGMSIPSLHTSQTTLARAQLSQRLGMPHRALALIDDAPPSSSLSVARRNLTEALGVTITTEEAHVILGEISQELRAQRGLSPEALQLTLNALSAIIDQPRGLHRLSSPQSVSWSHVLRVMTRGPQGYATWQLLVTDLLERISLKTDIDQALDQAQDRSRTRTGRSAGHRILCSELIKVAPIKAGEIYHALQSVCASQDVHTGSSRSEVTQAESTQHEVTVHILGGEALIERHLIADQLSASSRGALVEDAEELYHHVHYHLVRGRLTRTTRRVLQPHTARGAQALLQLSVARSLGGQLFTLDRAQHIRALTATRRESDPPEISRLSVPPTSRRDLSRPEDRMFYDLVAEEINFEAVRPGDLIDVQWSISELQVDHDNERLHADLLTLTSLLPRRCLIVTMSAEAQEMLNVELNLNGYQLESCELNLPRGGLLRDAQRIVSLANVPAVRWVSGAPRGTSRAPYLHLSNLGNWSTLRTLYRSTIQPIFEPHALLDETARQWTRSVKAWSGSRDDQARFEREVIEALYLEVTNRIRYVGLEFGRHSYFPASPQQTLTRQSGDCKDRAALMISLAASLGVPLDFVMVRTTHSGALNPKQLASLSAFDHAIIYSPTLRRYLDPTISASDPWSLPLPDQGAQALHVAFKSDPSPRLSHGASEQRGQLSQAGLVSIPSPPAQEQGESWSLELKAHPEAEAESPSALATRASLMWEMKLRGEPATRLRRALLSREHPRSWESVRAQVPVLEELTSREAPSSLVIDLAQRDPLSLKMGDQVNSAKLKARLPKFNLRERLSLTTSSRSTSLVIPASHFEQCIIDHRGGRRVSGQAYPKLEETSLSAWLAQTRGSLPKSPSPRASAELKRSLSGVCARIDLGADTVSPSDYPKLSAWLSEVEHLLDLNQLLTPQ